MNVSERLVLIFENNGIVIDSSLETNLNHYDLDSLTFVSIIIDIEREFQIVIPDEYYSIKSLSSISNLVDIINKLISCK